MMPSELHLPDSNDPLYSVCSFINAFNSNLIEDVSPGSVLCIDESMNSWAKKIRFQDVTKYHESHIQWDKNGKYSLMVLQT